MKINAIGVRIAMAFTALAVISLVNFGAVVMSNAPRVLASQGENFLDTTGSYSGLQAANRINGALDALLTCNKGSAAPTNAIDGAAKAGQCWLDDSNALMLIKKRYSGATWIVEGVIDVANGVWSPPIGGGAGTIASATTTDLCAAPAAFQSVSGTATITGFGSNCPSGIKKIVLFQGIANVTYNASSMILPGQRDFTSAAGDVLEAVSLGGGSWRVTSITKIDGNAVLSPAFRVGTIYNTIEDIDSKAVLAYGQALSRATYPDYLAASTRTQSGVFTSGNATITGVANTAGLGAGMPAESSGKIASGCTIASIVANSSITLNSNSCVIASGTVNFTVFKTGYGTGGDSTTVGVPNCEGRKIAGRSDMSGTDSATLPSATALNTTQGGKTQTVSSAYLPTTSPWSVVDTVAYSFTFGLASSATTGPGNYVNTIQPSGASGGTVLPVKSGSVSLATNVGGGTAMPIVDPTLIAECAIRVLP